MHEIVQETYLIAWYLVIYQCNLCRIGNCFRGTNVILPANAVRSLIPQECRWAAERPPGGRFRKKCSTFQCAANRLTGLAPANLFRLLLRWKIHKWHLLLGANQKKYRLLCVWLLIIHFAWEIKKNFFSGQQTIVDRFLIWVNTRQHWSNYETKSGSRRDVSWRSGAVHGIGWGT